MAKAEEALSIKRSLPHGHVAPILGIARTLGLPELLSERSGSAAGRRCRDLVLAMIVDRIIVPASKLATVRATTRRTEDDSPLHSFRSLLRDLATLVLNKVTVPTNPNYTTKPTPLQARAFQLLAVSPAL